MAEALELGSSMADLGFTAAYVYARDITEPDRIIALFADARPY